MKKKAVSKNFGKLNILKLKNSKIEEISTKDWRREENIAPPIENSLENEIELLSSFKLANCSKYIETKVSPKL